MSDVTFEAFDPADFKEWLERSQAEYIESRMTAGDTLEEATADAEASQGRTFPGGTPAPGQMVGRVVSDGVAVGELWVGQFDTDPTRWWVWDVTIDESRRGQGLGRRAMTMAERIAVDHGAQTIGLNVFAYNSVARNLYRSLGYQETSVQMRKDLSP